MTKPLDLQKVISGGQTGADEGGLRVAKALGIPTGGWMPKGCMTLEGPKPEFLEEYNMLEHASEGYAPRTEANVRDSHGTIRFAFNFKSAGERCTLKNIKKLPHAKVVDRPNQRRCRVSYATWIAENRIRVLNVAGNSDTTAPGIGDMVYEYLQDLLPHCMDPANIEAVLKNRYNLPD